MCTFSVEQYHRALCRVIGVLMLRMCKFGIFSIECASKKRTTKVVIQNDCALNLYCSFCFIVWQWKINQLQICVYKQKRAVKRVHFNQLAYVNIAMCEYTYICLTTKHAKDIIQTIFSFCS